MKRTSIRAAVFTIAAISLTTMAADRPASAVVTSLWVVDSYADWNAGEPEGAFVTSLGELKPGWATDRTELEFDNAWAAARAADGTVFLGTDAEGAIFQVRAGKVTKLATIADAVAVVSLALAADGTLYAGTMPGGQIWSVDSKSGQASKLATLDKAETVWALALGKDAKQLYAGTGPEGKLFAVDLATKKARVVFESEDKRIISLTATRDGAIWLGTSEKALLFRHDPAAKTTRAIADFSGNEVTATAEFDGGVIAIANEFEEPSTSGFKTKAAVDKAEKKENGGKKAKSPKTETKPGADKAPASAANVPRKGARKGKGALYRVYGDGRLEQIHALTQTYFSAVAVNSKGEVFAGAGDKGRIYLVDAKDAISTVFDVAERMVSHLILDDKDGIAFTTGDAAAFYRTSGRAKKSTYVSKAFDAKSPSRFGKLRWRGVGDLKIETRSGNTAEPGKGWSSWRVPAKIAKGGGGERSGRVASPSGRYLQLRVSFSGDPAAIMRRVTTYYLPQNQATKLTEVTVGDKKSGTPVVLKSTGAKPRSPVVKLKWKVDNSDGDATRYKLAVRREGDVLWRQISTGKKLLTETNYDWNTETYPDGYYRLRVTASDRLANSADRARESNETTELFLLDNTRPDIVGINVRYPEVSARAIDAMSTIAEMAYSVDDKPWQLGTTRDGIFDELAEFLAINVGDGLAAGVHTLAIRVSDEAGNIGSTTVTFRVK